MSDIDLDASDGAEQAAADLSIAIKREMLGIATELLRQLTISTAVDTGRLRFGWHISAESESQYSPPPGEYDFPSIEDHIFVSADDVNDTGVVYVNNNVEYGKYVNDGTSRQSPRRFVEASIARVYNSYQARQNVNISIGRLT